MGVANITPWQREYPAISGASRVFGLAAVEGYIFNDGANDVYGAVIRDAYIAQIWARMHGDAFSPPIDTLICFPNEAAHDYNQNIQYVTIEIIDPVPATTDISYGLPDVYQFGMFSFRSGGFNRNLEWLNFKQMFKEPLSPNVNGFSIYLKQGVTALVNVGDSPGAGNNIYHGPGLARCNPAKDVMPF